MNMQTRPQGGFASNVWLQLALLAIAVVVIVLGAIIIVLLIFQNLH